LKDASECRYTANCIIIAQFPIVNHSEQGQCAELSLKTIGKSGKRGDYDAIRSTLTVLADV
jgi:hypothetical protein